MPVLLTGVAGFIGLHVARALLANGETVLGIDNLNNYYDVGLKRARLELLAHPRFTFEKLDLADREALFACVDRHPDIEHIVHLAAQAGVRYSMIDPYAYVHSNVLGHLTVLEAARRLTRLRHLVYASSSSVYGTGNAVPFAETARVDTPASLYAATKRADELMSFAYSHQYGLPQSGLRFFTVYGPWGRPDMAYYAFARAIAAGEPITLYRAGTLRRDFTYVDDVVAGIVGLLDKPPPPQEPRVLNIGNSHSEYVSDLVRLLEASLGRSAILKDGPAPAADIGETCASIEAIAALTGFAPSTSLAVGIPRFAAWFREYHGLG